MKKYAILAALAILLISCKKDNQNPTLDIEIIPYFTTTVIKMHVAHSKGNEVMTAKWSLNDPKLADYKDASVRKESDALYIIELEDLEPDTWYCLRYRFAPAAEHTNPYREGDWGFQTQAYSTTAPNGVDAVAMGTVITRADKSQYEVFWANRNLGATTASDYGDYYAWAETETKDDYSWSKYLYYGGTRKVTKYCSEDKADFWGGEGKPDGFTTLYAVDDAAYQVCGEGWRTPTEEEWYALKVACNATWAPQDGINGLKLTSKSTANSIFLPAGDMRDGITPAYPGSAGKYWTATLGKELNGAFVPDCGTYANITSSGVNPSAFYYRNAGLSIRPCYSE